MAFFDSLLNKKKGNEEEIDSIDKIASDAATTVIKQLSGGDKSFSKKIADNVILFTNTSGGTGASTIACNVAYEVQRMGKKVLLIDANIMLPTQHLFLGIEQKIERKDIASFLQGSADLGECLVTPNGGLGASAGITLLNANNRTFYDELSLDNDAASKNTGLLIKESRRLFDLVIIDCPMKIEHMVYNTFIYSCDTIYCVWDEGITSILNTEKMRKTMGESGINSYVKMKIILNKRTNIPYNMYPFNKLNLELVEILPFDTAIIEDSQRGHIFCEKASSSSKNAAEFVRKIQSLSDKILKIGGLVE